MVVHLSCVDSGSGSGGIFRVVAGVQEEFQIVQAIVQGLRLGLGWRLGLETNHVPVCKT